MATPVVSAEDAAFVVRVPALLGALRAGELDEEEQRGLDDALDGRSNAPAHPSTVVALLSAGLIPLLLSLCT